MKTISKLMFLITIAIMMACGTVECPEFPDELMSWVNYKTNDKFYFKSDNSTLEFVVDNHFKSDDYSFKKNCDCLCDANAGFKTQENENGFIIDAHCSYFDKEFRISYKFSFNNVTHDYFGVNNDINNNYPYISNIIEYELNGTLLSNVIVVEEIHNEKILKAYFTKEKGLIAFIDNDNTEWQLVE